MDISQYLTEIISGLTISLLMIPEVLYSKKWIKNGLL
jgi:hypothetical protein